MRACLPDILDQFLKVVQTRLIWVPLCVLLLAAYVILLIYSTTYVGYLDHVEANIAAVSAILLRGAPLYHDLASAARYTTLYGPMTFLPYSLALRLFGAHVLSVKLVVLVANLCLLWMLWRCYRKLLDRPAALLVVASVMMFLLTNYGYVFQVRGDILLIFSATLGLYAVLCASPWISVLLLALACSLSLDVKVTAPFYFLPLYVLFIRRHGLRSALWASVGAIALAVFPFLFPQISVSQYSKWLHMASRLPRTRREILEELEVLLLVCAPVGLLLWQLMQTSWTGLSAYLKKNWVFLTTLIGSIAATAAMASVIGGGPHHFLPFFPLIGYLCADLYREATDTKVEKPRARRVSFVPLLWFWLALVILVQLRAGTSPVPWTLLTSRAQAIAVASDLQIVMKNHPDETIEMGYGNTVGWWNPGYRLTYFRPVLVFAGNPLTIEANAMGLMQIFGLDIPPSTLAYIQACKTQIWLIPKGQIPFGVVNFIELLDVPARRVPLFSDQFRETFLQHYRKREPSRYFDIWECKHD
jgi:hypothetical protein